METETNYRIDCHIGISENSGNIVYANDRHQLALSVWYRVLPDTEAGIGSAAELQEKIGIALYNQETGNSLEPGRGWRWSFEESWATPVEQLAGELGSKPEDETGYTKRTVYLSHSTDYDNEETLLVEVRARIMDPENPGNSLLTRSACGVTVHRIPARRYTWDDFTQDGPQYDHSYNDTTMMWSYGDNFSNFYRYAHFNVSLKDKSRYIKQVIYQHDPKALPKYSSRARNLYTTDAYVWPVSKDSIPNTIQEVEITAYLAPPYYEQPVSISYNRKFGFTVTLVCYCSVGYCYSLCCTAWDDTWCSASGCADSIDVYDDLGNKHTLFLNQAIPISWPYVKLDRIDKSSNDSFKSIMCYDSDVGKLGSSRYPVFNIKNYQYGWLSSWNDKDNVVTCGGKPIPVVGSAVIFPGDLTFSLFDGMSGNEYVSTPIWCYGGKPDNVDGGNGEEDWPIFIGHRGGLGYMPTFLIYPYWDVDSGLGTNDGISGFTMTVYNGSAWLPVKPEYGSQHNVFGTNTVLSENRFVWSIIPNTNA